MHPQLRSAIPIWKRAFDIFTASLFLLLTLPLLLLIAIFVRVLLGSPVLFLQVRPGLNGKPFTIFKFRTMRVDEDTRVGCDEQRLSSAGAFLRRASLDELPELWNVLRGEMSIVGPRPLLMQYLERYTPEQSRRHDVLPGITGWAQVNGRNAIGWEERFKLDVWYVDHLGFCLDLRIVARTIAKLLTGEGIRHSGHATMPEFMGAEIDEAQAAETRTLKRAALAEN